MNASMSKKHFDALAAALWSMHGLVASPDYNLGVENAAKSIADTCARFNPNFDRARFLTACGIEP